MKLTDFIQDAGRSVAFYPKLRRITGSTTATLFLCQLIYWKGKEADPDGWIYKTSEEMEEETGLSYNEQKTARANLKDAGLIEEHYARLDHKLKFRLNLDAINEKWGNADANNGESGNPSFGNDTSPDSLNESENTAENTNDSPKIAGIEAAIYQGRPVTETDLPAWENREKTAIGAFESAFGITRPWDWYPAKTTLEKTWRDFRKYLVELYEADKDCFTKYATWSRQPFSRGAMTGLGIKRNPQDFPDSWAAFCASEMYTGKVEQYKKYEEKEDNYVPNPNPKPRIG